MHPVALGRLVADLLARYGPGAGDGGARESVIPVASLVDEWLTASGQGAGSTASLADRVSGAAAADPHGAAEVEAAVARLRTSADGDVAAFVSRQFARVQGDRDAPDPDDEPLDDRPAPESAHGEPSPDHRDDRSDAYEPEESAYEDPETEW